MRVALFIIGGLIVYTALMCLVGRCLAVRLDPTRDHDRAMRALDRARRSEHTDGGQ